MGLFRSIGAFAQQIAVKGHVKDTTGEPVIGAVIRVKGTQTAIATDIDGTLLKDGTLMIDPEYMTVIEKLTSKGIIFVACSGRQFISERKLFAPVCDKLLYITDGGTVVRTPHSARRCLAWNV